jgi:hypothetical protein
VAGVSRLWGLDLVEFKSDEAGWLTLAENAVRLGQLPLAGLHSSQGITAPPHFAYLLTPLVALARAPEFSTAAIALANVAAVAGAGCLAWRAFGPLAAIAAIALYAVNPWAVFWARKVWQPDLMPPFAVLLFIALDLGIVQRRLGWAAAAVPIGVLATMVHLSFAVLLPVLIAPVLVLLGARRRRLLLAAVCVAGLIVLPSLFYEQQVVGWQDYRDLRYFQSQRSATNVVGLGYAVELATGWDARTLVNVPVQNFGWPVLVDVAGGVELALLGVALLVAFGGLVKADSGEERVRLIGLLVWLALPIVLTLRHNMLLYPHYYLLLLPAPVLLIGAAVQRGWSSGGLARGVAVPVMGVAVAMVVGVQALTTVQFFGYLRSTNPGCFYGMPLGRSREIAAGLTGLEQATHSSTLALETGAVGLGYLLRPDFARIDASDASIVALGNTPEAAGIPSASGVRVLGDWLAHLSVDDGQPRVAIAWQIGSDVDPSTRLQWQVLLGDVPVQGGAIHAAAELNGQPTMSLLETQVPASVADATYPVEVQLFDAASNQAVAFTLPDGTRTSRLALGDAHVAPNPACAPEESAL